MKIPDQFDLVISHGNCYDGMTAAWVAEKHSPNADIIFAQHHQKPPDVMGKRVLIVDFSYPRDEMAFVASTAKELLILDHHKTAAEALAPFVESGQAIFDMDRSGAGLAWDYLMPGEPRPVIVEHVEDRDLWEFELHGTREYHAAMTAYAMTFDNWDRIAAKSFTEMLEEGSRILSFTRLVADKLAARARVVTFEGIEWWAVNCPVEFVGETADILKHREPHRPVLSWMWDGDHGNYYCSLRSRSDGIDVSEIAKRHPRGGGHEHAAGFRSDRPPV